MLAQKLFPFAVIFFVIACSSPEDKAASDEPENKEKEAVESTEKMYGLEVDSFEILEGSIRRNENLASILLNFKVDYPLIDAIAKKSKDVFDVKHLRAGKTYKIFCDKKDPEKVSCLVYEKNPVEYVIYNLTDTIVYEGKKEVTIQQKKASGVISSSLYETMLKSDLDPLLAMQLADVYAWQVDFFRIQKDDKFKIIFEEKYVDGEMIGYGKILAAYFYHLDHEFYAFYFDKGADHTRHIYSAYFDEKGESLQKAFLKAPLKYRRISSRYTKKRYHPVLKRYKSHLGTDYAAPEGTPIYAVGDGEVIEAGYTSGNGNYVKIRHNRNYTTGYLHMSNINKEIKKGTYVEQKQVIGYVGSTGLSTGPHLCFRFYKDGHQVDPFKVEIPPSEPVNEEYREEYEEFKKKMMAELEKIPFNEQNKLPIAASETDNKREAL